MATNRQPSCSLILALASFALCCAGLVEAIDWSQVQGLLTLQKLLESPSATAGWHSGTDFCYLPPSALLNITCAGDTVTYLRIVGDKSESSVREKLTQATSQLGGSLGPKKSLSSVFSVETLADTLLNDFPELRGIELVSLGMWGNLPERLGQMRNLQVLNASSNLFTGAIPRSLGDVAGLQALALDNNALNGSLPYWLSSLPAIDTLSLSNNCLSGELNGSISYFSSLKTLSLGHNLLAGAIPSSITSLKNLQLLSLAHNQLSGPIPNLEPLSNLKALDVRGNSFGPGFPTLGAQLTTVCMGQNQLTGSISAFFKDFAALQTLDISANALASTLPPFLFALPSISSLNLSRNRFTGTLPLNLYLSKSLAFLDVSGNFLTGEPPLSFAARNVTVYFQSNCMSTSRQKQGHCGALTAAKLGIQKAPDSHRVAIITAAVGGGVGLTVAFCALLFLLVRRSCDSDQESAAAPEDGIHHSFAGSAVGIPSELLFNARYISQSKRLGELLPQSKSRTFTIAELKAATNNFSAAAFVGEGSHGKVFKGQLEDKSHVAIKWLAFKSKDDMSELKAQAEVLCRLRHRNLVSVLGYCAEELTAKDVGESAEEHKSFCLFIVSEFVEHGDLRSHLTSQRHKGQEALSWSQRLAAVIGAGRGLHYLHTGIAPPVFHNSLKITDILLDANMVAQVCGFGLLPGRRAPFSVDVVAAELKSGAPRLVHEDSLRSRHAERRDKQDVYDFGVILLEVILGRPPTIRNPFPQKRSELERLTKEKGPSMELIDGAIVGACGAESLATVLEIAGKCLLDEPLRRPSMEDVLWNLQYAVQVQRTSVSDDRDLRWEDFPRAASPAAERKRAGSHHDNRVSDEDWKGAGPSASRNFLR